MRASPGATACTNCCAALPGYGWCFQRFHPLRSRVSAGVGGTASRSVLQASDALRTAVCVGCLRAVGCSGNGGAYTTGAQQYNVAPQYQCVCGCVWACREPWGAGRGASRDAGVSLMARVQTRATCAGRAAAVRLSEHATSGACGPGVPRCIRWRVPAARWWLRSAHRRLRPAVVRADSGCQQRVRQPGSRRQQAAGSFGPRGWRLRWSCAP